MIKVHAQIYDGMIYNLTVLGHAPKETHALLCNSVSCLTQTFLQSCLSLVSENIKFNSLKGEIKLLIDLDQLNDQKKSILDTLSKSYLIGIRGISQLNSAYLDLILEKKEM